MPLVTSRDLTRERARGCWWVLALSTTSLWGCGEASEARPNATQVESVERSTTLLGSVRARFGALSQTGEVTALTRDGEQLAPSLAERGRARVTFGENAAEGVTIVDDVTGVGTSFALIGSVSGALSLEDGHVVTSAGPGLRSLYAVSARGVEDFVLLEQPAPAGAVRYRVQPIATRALRQVGDTLELLDAFGSPRVRVRPPYVIDARGARHEAALEVAGCAVDRDPRSPWGRELTELDHDACELVVRYDSALEHPVLVDPEWQIAAFMSHERTHHTATLLPDSSTVLVVGGFDASGAPVAEAEILCPEDAICPGGVAFAATGSLATARGAHAEAFLDASDRVLISGGRSSRASATAIASAEQYDVAAGAFFPAGALSVGRFGHTATVLNDGRVLIAAGEDGAAPSTAQIYDPASGFGAAFPMSGEHRRGHVAEILNDGKVLVAGGVGSVGNLAVASAEVFDPTSGNFTALVGANTQMTAARAWATATRLEDAQGRVLIVGGTNNAGFYSQTIDLFLPSVSGGTFQQTVVSMQKPRAFHTATKLIGEGKVLIAGGFSGTVVQDDAEVFDQTTSSFVTALSTEMVRGHDFHSATRLNSGKVVVIGGGVGGTALAPGSGAVDVIAASQAEILARVNGEPCDFDGECLSNHCYEAPGGICCNETCADVCSSCYAAKQAAPAPGDGICAVVADGEPVQPQCTAGVELVLQCTAGEIDVTGVNSCEPYVCDDATDECALACTSDPGCHEDYHCVEPGDELEPEGADVDTCIDDFVDGTPCNRNAQCLSNQCVDGVCCNSACGEQCQACDVEGFVGTCSQVEGAPRGGRPACLGDDTGCEGQCGSTPVACDYDTQAECGSSACAGGERDFGRCSATTDGSGQVTAYECAPANEACAPFACDSQGEACVASCESIEDCAEGAVCRSDGDCVEVENAECLDDRTLADPSGTQTDCSPFRCAQDRCLEECRSIDDCVEGLVCDTNRQCIDPPADPPPPEDCAMRSGPRPGRGALTLLGLALLGLSARRRTYGGGK